VIEARSSSCRANFESWAEDILKPADAPPVVEAAGEWRRAAEPDEPATSKRIWIGVRQGDLRKQPPASCRVIGVAPKELMDHIGREIVALLRPQVGGRSRRQQE
jgi:hypothetical protein